MLTVKQKITPRILTKISILSVIAFLIMFIEVPLWFTPEFLKIDLSDIPALIGGFALGPMAGVAIEFLKNILHMSLKGTVTAGVGELANFFVGSAFVYTATILYYRKKSLKTAVIGMILGTIVMTTLAALANYLVLIPLYAKIFGAPIEYFVELASKVNGYVVDFRSFILFGIVPFNFLKGIMVSLITIPLYKKISPILHR